MGSTRYSQKCAVRSVSGGQNRVRLYAFLNSTFHRSALLFWIFSDGHFFYARRSAYHIFFLSCETRKLRRTARRNATVQWWVSISGFDTHLQVHSTFRGAHHPHAVCRSISGFGAFDVPRYQPTRQPGPALPGPFRRMATYPDGVHTRYKRRDMRGGHEREAKPSCPGRRSSSIDDRRSDPESSF